MTPPTDQHPLIVEHLTKRYGDHIVVDDLTFTVEPGRVTGLLGPNGSGKSTTMKMMVDLATADQGLATIGARRYRDLNDPTRTVGAMIESDAFHPGRSGRNHLRILADATAIPHHRVDAMLEEVGLADAARRQAGAYSLGMRQRLGLAAALLGEPPVLILDEPGNGLDPEGIRTLRDRLRTHAAAGGTVLVSSHLLAEVEHLADDVIVINQGQLVTQGPHRHHQHHHPHGTWPARVRVRARRHARKGHPARRDSHRRAPTTEPLPHLRPPSPRAGADMTIRVAVVDDQALVRRGFAMVLGHQPDIDIVAEAGTGIEAIAATRQHRPDVVLMDIRRPEMDGLTATATILEEADWPLKVIILTTFDPDEYVYRALQAGASGFVLKDIPPEDLAPAVRAVAAGGALLGPTITRRLIGRFTRTLATDTTTARRLNTLTDREREVLTELAQGSTNAEISNTLYIGAATVKSHVSSILTKLGLRDRTQAVIFAYESGLITPGHHDIGH